MSILLGIAGLPIDGIAGPLKKKSNSRGNSGILKRVFKPPSAPTKKSSRSSVSSTTVKKPSSARRGSSYRAPTRIASKRSLDPVQRSNPKQPRVFILGDSQGFTDFGPTLQRELVSQGYEVLYHAVKNGSPYYWSGLWDSPVLTRVFPPAASPSQIADPAEVSMTPHTIEEYANVFAPDIFVVQAGTNFEVDLARDNPVQISKLIRDCLKTAESEGARILWVGPPDARDDVKSPEFQKLAINTLQEAVKPWSESQGRPCFFDSRPVSPMSNRTRGDGEHPENDLARDWAVSAASWIDESAEFFLSRKMLRCQAAGKLKEGKSAVPELLTQPRLETTPTRTLTMKLRLSGKSSPKQIETLPYTDAFSVYRYELLNPDEIYGVEDVLTTDSENSNRYWVYVLHWTVHNPGAGPRLTQIAEFRTGEIHTLELARVEHHPLGDALKTMPRFDSFDDFLAPLFVSKDILQERGSSAEIVSTAGKP